MPKKYEAEKILKVIKKKFACNGTVIKDKTVEQLIGDVIQLQGDQRKNVLDFLSDEKHGMGDEIDKESIKIHGF